MLNHLNVSRTNCLTRYTELPNSVLFNPFTTTACKTSGLYKCTFSNVHPFTCPCEQGEALILNLARLLVVCRVMSIAVKGLNI